MEAPQMERMEEEAEVSTLGASRSMYSPPTFGEVLAALI
jgi:hypothetical protein